jgi:hypothetical protein
MRREVVKGLEPVLALETWYCNVMLAKRPTDTRFLPSMP